MLEANIAIERVDERVKTAFDRSAARRTANLEIGNVHRAMCFDLCQCSPEIVVRGQHPVDATKDAEVSVLELVGAGHRRLSRVGGILRAEMAARLVFAGGPRVYEVDF